MSENSVGASKRTKSINKKQLKSFIRHYIFEILLIIFILINAIYCAVAAVVGRLSFTT